MAHFDIDFARYYFGRVINRRNMRPSSKLEQERGKSAIHDNWGGLHASTSKRHHFQTLDYSLGVVGPKFFTCLDELRLLLPRPGGPIFVSLMCMYLGYTCFSPSVAPDYSMCRKMYVFYRIRSSRASLASRIWSSHGNKLSSARGYICLLISHLYGVNYDVSIRICKRGVIYYTILVSKTVILNA